MKIYQHKNSIKSYQKMNFLYTVFVEMLQQSHLQCDVVMWRGYNTGSMIAPFLLWPLGCGDTIIAYIITSLRMWTESFLFLP